VRRLFILLAAAGVMLFTCVITDDQNEGFVLLEATDTDDDAAIKLMVKDTWIIGETKEWGTVQIRVDDDVVFTAGDTVQVWKSGC